MCLGPSDPTFCKLTQLFVVPTLVIMSHFWLSAPSALMCSQNSLSLSAKTAHPGVPGFPSPWEQCQRQQTELLLAFLDAGSLQIRSSQCSSLNAELSTKELIPLFRRYFPQPVLFQSSLWSHSLFQKRVLWYVQFSVFCPVVNRPWACIFTAPLLSPFPLQFSLFCSVCSSFRTCCDLCRGCHH